jgi:uncharacterized protein YqhQ
MSEKFQYGGQAVIEGVMMRSPRFVAVACRKPDSTIVVQAEPVEKSIIGKFLWLNRPFLRGSLALLDAMALGAKALSFSANVQAEEIGKEKKQPEAAESVAEGVAASAALLTPSAVSTDSPRPGSISSIAIGMTLVLSFLFGLGLFVALPTLITQFAQNSGLEYKLALNLLDGVISLSLFLGYIALISRMENIRRVFQYHGAEHKAINALESGEELSLENAMRSSRIHPRCGTSFVIIVLLITVIVHSILPRPESYPIRLMFHLSLIPLLAGASYEIIRVAGKYRHLPWLGALLAPGQWTQRLTTREPDADQVEVALAALNAVMTREEEREEKAREQAKVDTAVQAVA